MDKEEQKTIFIVEDNAVYAKSLRGFLITHFPEMKIEVFPIGEMLLNVLHRNPNIVIMDYFLNTTYWAAQNGLEVIKQIKEQKPQIKIIVLSSQGNHNVVSEAINQYGCAYVQKEMEAFGKVKQLIEDYSC
jgi:DNA-binding NarL/FixJ family response regulator